METKRPKYLESYLDEVRSLGRYTITSNEVKNYFGLTDNAFKKVVQRLQKKNRIARLRNNFYLILPPEYRRIGTLPLHYFIDDLMSYLDRSYYIGLITAAMYHGAAHQQPQHSYIVIEPPYIRPIRNNHQSIIFCIKKKWNPKDIQQMKTDAGFINVSSPELTALDLVSFVDRVGGYNRVVTILSELAEVIDPKQLYSTANHYDTLSVIQRVGYILEYILEAAELSDMLFETLSGQSFYPVFLDPSSSRNGSRSTKNRWKIIPNIELMSEV